MSLKSFARRGPTVWFAALVIAGACTAGVDTLTGPSPSNGPALDIGTPSATGVIITQVYGGGGNTGAQYKNDFIELYNGGSNPVDLSTWSVQYASATGPSWTNKTNLTGTIAPGHYYLVQEAASTVGAALPAPDATGAINMSATAGKVALVASQTVLTGVCPSADATIVDFVGFGTTANCFEGSGATAAPSNTASVSRNASNTDSNNNASDFTTGAPNPRNSSVGTVVITVPLDHVTIAAGPSTVPAGSTVTFSAAALSADDKPATGATITWTSSDPSIATVDNTGKVAGVVASGTPVTLTATAVANGVTKFSTVSITVTTPLGSSGVVISQVYGGGGNAGATLKNDFIELYNSGTQPVSLAGWSVQYSSPTAGSWTTTPLTGVVQPGGYYLVQESAGAGGTQDLPTADVIGTLALGGTAGKIALVRNTTALTGCPASTDASLADLVGYGTTANCFEGSAPTAVLTNTTAAIRKGAGNVDTDDNASDFDVAAPAPRNAASPHNVVAGPLDHVVIAGTASSVTVGTTLQLSASGQDAANVAVVSAKITWTSSDPSIASVSATGKVTGVTVSATPVTITASALSNGITKTATRSITAVAPAPVASVVVTPPTYSLKAGLTKAMTASALDAGGNATSTTFTWSSADATIATIDPSTGLLTAKKIGTVVITATAANGTTGTASVEVLDASNVTVTTGKTALALGMQTQFFYGGTDGSGATVTSVVWSTSDASVITVDQHGVVTGKGIGAAQLVATAPDGSKGTANMSVYLAAGSTDVRLGHNEEFGQPKDADPSNDFIIRRAQYTVSYNAARGGANWVSWNLDRTHVGTNGRCVGTCYSADTALTNAGITAYTTADWVSGSTYDRGHMAPSADWTSSEADNNTTFFLTNFVPQTHDMNAGPWERLETALRDSVAGGREAYIIAGGVFKNGVGLGTLLNLGKIAIPNSTWKIAVITPAGTGINADGTLPPNTTVLAVDMPNITGISGDPFEKYLTTVDKIQQETGYDFLALLADNVECRVEVRNCAPSAHISGAGLAGGNEGQTLSFSASTSSDPDAGDVLSYAWSVNGAAAGSQAALNYTFTNNGTYTLRLIAADDKGAADTVSTTVAIQNVAPTVNAIAAATVAEGSSYTATGTFTDPGLDSWTAVVDYGDNSGPQTIAAGNGSFALSHVYADNGTYTVTVTVKDNDGGSGAATGTVTVTNVAPTVSAIAGATLLRGESYTATGTFTDPGSDSWTATVNYGEGSTVALPLAGNSFSLQHAYATTGVMTVTVTVTDDDNGTGTRTAQITVLTGTQSIGVLASSVSALASAGKMDDKDAKWIGNKLDIASKELARGNLQPALNQLSEVQKRLASAQSDGTLPAADAAALTAYLNRIVASIS